MSPNNCRTFQLFEVIFIVSPVLSRTKFHKTIDKKREREKKKVEEKITEERSSMYIDGCTQKKKGEVLFGQFAMTPFFFFLMIRSYHGTKKNPTLFHS